jgi:exodeoxyribonuclease VII large subunit
MHMDRGQPGHWRTPDVSGDDNSLAAAAPRVWTVSELNRLVKDLLEQSVQPFWLRGEIGDLTIHRSGHVYFTLKDARSQVPAVMFRGAETARQLHVHTGMEIDVFGRLTVYEPRGAYQILVQFIRPQGIGDLQKRFEELKARLRAEGLFDEERKRAVPQLPRCVGLVTSPEGAAIRDFLRLLGQRFAAVHVRLVPVAVQGAEAAAQIAAAIGFLNQSQACDVIVVTRGGGSLEDLWAFNEEAVARAVAGSAIPVISAVGHERDFTICDFVADVRAATPSAAAELVIGARAELLERIHVSRGRLHQALALRVARLRERLQRTLAQRVLHEPAAAVRVFHQRIDELTARLASGLQRQAERAGSRAQNLSGRLAALNPRRVLARGYAILVDGEGRAVRHAAETTPGAALTGLLYDGSLGLQVQRVIPEPPAPDQGATPGDLP